MLQFVGVEHDPDSRYQHLRDLEVDGSDGTTTRYQEAGHPVATGERVTCRPRRCLIAALSRVTSRNCDTVAAR
jgi:hypothetical protein